MMMRRNLSKALFILMFAITHMAYGEPVVSPMQLFLEAELKAGRLLKNTEVYVFKVDLNNDGFVDWFITSDIGDRDNARAGKDWDVYWGGKDGFTAKGKITAQDTVTIQNIPEAGGNPAIISIFPSGAGAGSVMGYYSAGSMEITRLDLGRYKLGPDNKPLKGFENILERFSGGVEPKLEVSGLDKLLPESVVESLPTIKKDFYDKHMLFVDSEDPSRDKVFRLLPDGKLGEFVGYWKDGKLISAGKEAKKKLEPPVRIEQYVAPDSGKDEGTGSKFSIYFVFLILLAVVLIFVYKRK
ncbi:MAG: hypothetical protein OEY52_09190 [Gammaproteobacteria bacterium]|nr:hypothetical protein [Gammaproteobacteria bacterium]